MATSPDLDLRSRRALLGAALGGLATGVAAVLGRPAPAAAAAGDPLILGAANFSEGNQTTLTIGGQGAAFTLRTTNAASGATGIFGWTSQTTGHPTRGVYGKADGHNSDGIHAVQNGLHGTGAALRADGGENVAIQATSRSPLEPTIRVVHTMGGSAIEASSTSGYAAAFASPILAAGHVDVTEIPTPTAPPADGARLFARDDGFGKTELCVIFPAGNVVVLGTSS